jgi:hypothetical protein
LEPVTAPTGFVADALRWKPNAESESSVKLPAIPTLFQFANFQTQIKKMEGEQRYASLQAELASVQSKVNSWAMNKETDLQSMKTSHTTFLDTHAGWSRHVSRSQVSQSLTLFSSNSIDTATEDKRKAGQVKIRKEFTR